MVAAIARAVTNAAPLAAMPGAVLNRRFAYAVRVVPLKMAAVIVRAVIPAAKSGAIHIVAQDG